MLNTINTFFFRQLSSCSKALTQVEEHDESVKNKHFKKQVNAKHIRLGRFGAFSKFLLAASGLAYLPIRPFSPLVEGELEEATGIPPIYDISK
jgi:hypothetical protein